MGSCRGVKRRILLPAIRTTRLISSKFPETQWGPRFSGATENTQVTQRPNLLNISYFRMNNAGFILWTLSKNVACQSETELYTLHKAISLPQPYGSCFKNSLYRVLTKEDKKGNVRLILYEKATGLY